MINKNLIIPGPLIIFFILVTVTSAQLKGKVDLETGYYNFKNSKDFNNAASLKLNGRINYKGAIKNHILSFGLGISPEIYLNKSSDFFSQKIFCSGGYKSPLIEFIDWGISANIDKKIYDFSNLRFTVSSLYIEPEFTLYSDRIFKWENKFTFGYQEISDKFEQNSDIFRFSSRFSDNLFKSVNYSAGIQLEKFTFTTILSLSQTMSIKNKGNKAGIIIGLNNSRNILFNIYYNLNMIFSNYSDPGSLEHNINVFAAKSFSKELSLFFLLDYNLCKIKLKTASELYLIIPNNNENQVYLKLNYRLSEMFDIYLRNSYNNNRINIIGKTISAWNGFIGLQWNINRK